MKLRFGVGDEKTGVSFTGSVFRMTSRSLSVEDMSFCFGKRVSGLLGYCRAGKSDSIVADQVATAILARTEICAILTD